jgi:peroxiredoxin
MFKHDNGTVRRSDDSRNDHDAQPSSVSSVRKVANLEAFNGDPSWRLPMPSRFVIVRSGTISYSEINPDHTVRSEPADLLPVVEALQRLTEG